jgi:hypothetical protein
VRSATLEVTVAEPQPAREHVTLVGDLQDQIGCPNEWDPTCTVTRLSFDTDDGQWHGTFDVPAGSYQWKIAVNDSFDENYGDGGAAGGSNLTLTVPAGGGTYRFSWNQVSHVPSVEEVS